MKKLIIIIAVITLISSCTKEIKLKEEYIKPKLVGYCLFTEKLGYSYRFNLNTSASIFTKDSITSVKNAHISILDEDGQLIEVLQENVENVSYYGFDTYYKGQNTFLKGKEYSVTVEAEGYETISATSKVPDDAIFEVNSKFYVEEVHLQVTEDYFEEFLYKMEIDIEFSDNADEDNYYIVNVDQWGTEFNENFYGGIGYLSTKDPNIERMDFELDFEAEYRDNSLLLRDQNFNGKKYTLKFNTNIAIGQITNVGGIDHYDGGILNVNVYSVDKSYFLYTLSKEKYNNTGGDPFSTPVKVYSNFENGLGIFAGYNSQTFEIDISNLVESK